MADFMTEGPDDVSAHLTDHAQRPGESHANIEDDRAEGGRAEGDRAEDDRTGHGTRDERLADFAQHRCGDTARPNAWHVMILNDLTGPDDRCPDATDNEALGLMGRWNAVESWVAARKLGVVREMIRRRAVPEKGMAKADLPWEWERELEHEVAAQLRVSLVAAGKLLHLAWSLEARLPRVGDALSDGRLDPGQAKMIVSETDALPDDKAAAAEELILAGLDACKTWADLLRLVQRAVCTVDPDGARRRREEAERQSARVRLWRESSGACALAGHALPADEALAAWAQVEARAQHYRRHGVKEYIDLLRVMAYLDLLNGAPAEDRIARWTAEAARKAGTAQAGTGPSDAAEGQEAAGAGHQAADAAPGRPRPGPHGTGNRHGTPARTASGNGHPRGGPPDTGHRDPDDDGRPGADDSTDDPRDTCPGPDDAGNACPGPDDGPDDTANARPNGDPGPADAAASEPQAGPELRAKVNLTIPMGTATGHASRPGEAWELGALDPALARQLLAAAARSPGSDFCVTLVDQHGHAAGHGCAKPAKRGSRPGPARARPARRPGDLHPARRPGTVTRIRVMDAHPARHRPPAHRRPQARAHPRLRPRLRVSRA